MLRAFPQKEKKKKTCYMPILFAYIGNHKLLGQRFPIVVDIISLHSK